MLQSRTFQVFHGDKGFAVLFANIVNRANVGMIQGGRGLRLALKTTERLGIARHLIRKELQSNEAVQASVLGLVDHTHPSAAEFFEDPVVRDRLPDH